MLRTRDLVAILVRHCFHSIPFVVFVLLCSLVWADSTGKIVGTVIDPTGAVIPGATITLRNAANALKQTAISGSDGNFILSGLVPGPYRIEIAASGFKPYSHDGFTISEGQTVTTEFKLTVSSESTSVEVAEDNVQIDLSSTE